MTKYNIDLSEVKEDEQRNTTSTLNGQWPSDTWFQRARALQLKREAAEIEAKNAKMRAVQS